MRLTFLKKKRAVGFFQAAGLTAGCLFLGAAAGLTQEPPKAAKTMRESARVPAKGKALKPKGRTLLVDDFETGGVQNKLGGTWQVEMDQHHLGTTINTKDKFIAKGGAEGSNYCARIKGHYGKNIAPWPFASVYTSLDAKDPVDLRSFKAVEFMAKGDGKTYDALVYVSQVKDFAHFRASFKAPAQWTKIHLDFKDFRQPEWGVKVRRDFRSVLELLFAPLQLNNEEYDLAIDNLKFVK